MVLREFRPAFKYDELRIGEAEGCGANYVRRLVMEPRVIARNAIERLGRGVCYDYGEGPWPASYIVRGEDVRVEIYRATKLLSLLAWNPHISGSERRLV